MGDTAAEISQAVATVFPWSKNIDVLVPCGVQYQKGN